MPNQETSKIKDPELRRPQRQKSIRRIVRDVGFFVAGAASCVFPDAVQRPETYGLRTVEVSVKTTGSGIGRKCEIDVKGQMPAWLFIARGALGIREEQHLEYYNKINEDASINPKSGWQNVTEPVQPTTMIYDAPEGLNREEEPYVQVMYRPKGKIYGSSFVYTRPLTECF